MRYTYRIITLNINGIENQTRLRLLEEFIKRHDIDIALLQEVTDEEKLTCRGISRKSKCKDYRQMLLRAGIA